MNIWHELQRRVARSGTPGRGDVRANRRMIGFCALLLVSLEVASGGPVSLARQGENDSTGSARADFVVMTLSAEEVAGRLEHLSNSGGVVLMLPDGTMRQIPLAEMVRLRRLGEPRPVAAADPPTVAVDLQNGDRISGVPERFTGEDAGPTLQSAGPTNRSVVHLRTGSLGAVAIPLDQIRRWRTLSDAQVDSPQTHGSDRLDDVVQLTNGDEIRGIVTRIDGTGFAIETDAGERTIPHQVIDVVDMIPAPPRPRRDRLAVRLRTVDGNVITAEEIDFSSNGVLRLHTSLAPLLSNSAGARAANVLELRVDMLASAEIVGGRWVWLSTLPPAIARHTAMLSISWPHRNDFNVRGRPIRVAGSTFERGIGVHSASSLTYELNGHYAEFLTSYGLDDDSGELADVDVEILIDGERRHRAVGVGAGVLHGPIRIDITGAGLLELRVEHGRHADVQDRFNWVEPALIRAE